MLWHVSMDIDKYFIYSTSMLIFWKQKNKGCNGKKTNKQTPTMIIFCTWMICCIIIIGAQHRPSIFDCNTPYVNPYFGHIKRYLRKSSGKSSFFCFFLTCYPAAGCSIKGIFIHWNIFHHNIATDCATLVFFLSLSEPILNLLCKQEVAGSACENTGVKCWFCTCKAAG